MRVSYRLEDIFAHAVALQQSGRLRSTIFGIGRKVYILNQDHTALLRFRLRKVDKVEFDPPISFEANDYDSQEVDVQDGRICFVQKAAGFERTKSCRTPSLTPEDVEDLFRSFHVEETNTIVLHAKMLTLLDESLSHIEFSAEDGELRIVQRNIYSGTVTEIKRKSSGGLLEVTDELEDFEPTGLRTNDFMALFSFVDSLAFHFLPDGVICVDSKDARMPMRALISKCRYDELGGTEDERFDR